MSLFDNRPEKSRYKRKPFHGVVGGLVTNRDDPEDLGRVKLLIPAILGVDKESDWAYPIVPFSGTQLIPKVDDPVWVIFKGGDINKPLYAGTWYKSGVLPDPEHLDRHYLYFWNREEGQEVPFVIYVEPETHSIILGNDKEFFLKFLEEEIVLHNREETAKITLKQDGKIIVDTEEVTVNCEGQATLNAKGKVSVNADDTVTVKSPKTEVDSDEVVLAGGGPGIARLGDEVRVPVSWTSSAGAGVFSGTITSASDKAKSG